MATAASIKLKLRFPKRVWFVWQVHVNSSLVVYMFGLHVNSTNQPGKYHFVKKVGKKLVLSKPQSEPENNLPIIDARCFEVLSLPMNGVMSKVNCLSPTTLKKK